MKKFIYFLLIIKIFLNISFTNDDFYIKDINIVGVNNFIDKKIFKEIYLLKNKYINMESIKYKLKKLFKNNLHNNLSFDIKNNILNIYLEENFIINNIIINNNKDLSKEKIQECLSFNNIKNNKVFNELNFFKFKQNLLELYSLIGKYNVNIYKKFLNNNKNNKNKLDINIDIIEGDFTLINNIYIKNNKNISKKEIFKILDFSESSFFSKKNKKIYIKNEIINSLNKLQDIYLNNGFAKLIINIDKKFNKDNKLIDIFININEGKIYNIKNIDIKLIYDKKYHNECKKLEKIIKEFCNINNELYNLSKINEIKLNIENILNKNSFLNNKIVISEKEIDNNLLILNFDINFNNKAIVKKIDIEGNKIISKEIIKKNIKHKTDEILNFNRINEDIDNLKKLKYFENVTIKIEKIIKNEYKIVFIVEENDSNKFLINTNFNFKKPNVILNFNKKNILNTNNSINLNTIYSKEDKLFNYSLENLFFIINNNIKLRFNAYKRFNYIHDKQNSFKIENYGISNAIYKFINDNYYTKLKITYLNNNIKPFICYKNGFIYNKNIKCLKIFNNKYFNNKNILKYTKKNRKIKNYEDFLLTFKINKLFEKNINSKISIVYDFFLPISYNKNIKKLFIRNINYLNNINSIFSFKNKIDIFNINNIFIKDLFYDEGYYEYVNKVNGFIYNYIKKPISKNKNNHKYKKNSSYILVSNELILPDFIDVNFIKENFIFSIFLNNSINFYSETLKNIFKYKKYFHVSYGFNCRIMTFLGSFNISFSIPVIKCKNEKTEFFQLNISE